MADDVTFGAGNNATPPDLTKAATDEITAGAHTGAHAGIAKLAVSADGDGTHLPATAADGLLVNLGANNDVTVTGAVTVAEPVSVDDNGASLTVDAPLATPVHTRLSDGVDVTNVTAAGELNVLASAQPGVDIGDVTVNNGAGAAAVNIQDGGNSITVDGTVSVTEPVSVDDNGGSLTVDAPLATPVHTRISDGTDAVNVTAAGALVVDGSAVTQPVSGTVSVTEPVSVDDNGASLTIDNSTLAVVGGGTEAAALRVTLANDSTGLVSVDDNGGSLTVDGTVTANQGAAGTAWEVVGDVAADIAVPANPVAVGGRASTAQPTAVSADGDSVYAWMTRRGAPVVTMAPHIGLFAGEPWTLVSETAQYTTTQTSTVLVAGGASERLVVTNVQIQVGGTTAGSVQLYFGTGAYARGTNFALFDGEFAPSTTLKPGVVMSGPFISPTNGDDILVTTSAAINPLTITVWYYVVI